MCCVLVSAYVCCYCVCFSCGLCVCIFYLFGLCFFFFFQAEDGIRDHCVTGVQTCALPICQGDSRRRRRGRVHARRRRRAGALRRAARADRPRRGGSRAGRRGGAAQGQGGAQAGAPDEAARGGGGGGGGGGGEAEGREEEVAAVSQRKYLLLLVALVGACARAPRPAAVTPADIPTLLAQTQQQPTDAALRFRLAAALAAPGRCDTATSVARSAEALDPADVLGPLIVGGCQEQAGGYDDAVATYNDFAARHPDARGVAALRARAQLALRAGAEQTARQALARETELAQQPPQAATVAVLPVAISGDSSYQPLSRGLAELLTTDLALIRTLRLLERLQIGRSEEHTSELQSHSDLVCR